ncbi:hypothetical protein F4775DRAFT_593683 [Biscogniauxia sp. FL1348]|nr:hypothetical protein F4775DRAFT_593683 [Biscogniauxia sp. FL1348]
MQVLPFVQVRDLAPSASFYSAVTQPLGLRYLSASPTNIVFGYTSSGSPEPVFEVKKSSGPPRPARLVLSAHTTSVVSAFHAAALRAHPDLKKILPSTPTGGDGCTEIPDFDGNVMEVVYVNPPDYPSDYAGSTVRRTQSTPQEVSRILDWNLDVATAAPSRAVTTARSAAPSSRTVAVRGGEEPYSQLKRSMTTSSVDSPSAREREREREAAARSSGGGGMTFGSVLAGVAAGALVGGALTYTVLRKDRDRAPQTQVYEAPAMPRRSTYHADPSSRQIEVERAIVDKTQYPETTTSTSKKYPPSAYGARYAQAGLPKSKTLDDFDDRASRHYNGNGSRARTRSVSEATRRPLMIADVEHRSNAGGPTTSSSSRHAEAPIPPPAPVPPKSEAASTKLLLDASADARSQVSAASSIMPPHLHKFYPEASYRAHKNLTKQAIAASAMRKPREPVRAPSPPRAPSVYAHEVGTAPADKDEYEYEYRSQAASATRRRGAPREPSRTRHSYREPDAETYVSAAARSAATTVRDPAKQSQSQSKSKRSGGGGSRYSVATGTTTPRSEARPRRSSRSVVWDEDDDRASVAPSDSISCIGDKQDRRRTYY